MWQTEKGVRVAIRKKEMHPTPEMSEKQGAMSVEVGELKGCAVSI